MRGSSVVVMAGASCSSEREKHSGKEFRSRDGWSSCSSEGELRSERELRNYILVYIIYMYVMAGAIFCSSNGRCLCSTSWTEGRPFCAAVDGTQARLLLLTGSEFGNHSKPSLCDLKPD